MVIFLVILRAFVLLVKCREGSFLRVPAGIEKSLAIGLLLKLRASSK